MQRIDYHITLNHITEASETPHQAKQWFIVQQQHSGEIARVRLALHSLLGTSKNLIFDKCRR